MNILSHIGIYPVCQHKKHNILTEQAFSSHNISLASPVLSLTHSAHLTTSFLSPSVLAGVVWLSPTKTIFACIKIILKYKKQFNLEWTYVLNFNLVNFLFMYPYSSNFCVPLHEFGH